MTESHFFHGSLNAPVTNDADLVALFGSKGYSDDVAPYQYAAWAEGVGLTSFLAEKGTAGLESIVSGTALTEPGADSLVGVLASYGLLLRTPAGISLSPLVNEYLVPGKPFYMGDSFYLTCRKPIPAFFVKLDENTGRPMSLTAGQKVAHEPKSGIGLFFLRLIKRMKGWEFGGHQILINQHSRNLPANVAASQLPIFDSSHCLVDMAGGSGTFAIPLARRFPGMRIVLTDLPQSLSEVRKYLEDYGVQDKVELVGMDAFSEIWPIPECDVVFFGNFIHGFSHDQCVNFARKSKAKLRPGGKIVFHELVWNENRDGPVKTALFHVTMRSRGGAQRTVSELHDILAAAGFDQLFAYPTSGGFVAVGGINPE